MNVLDMVVVFCDVVFMVIVPLSSLFLVQQHYTPTTAPTHLPTTLVSYPFNHSTIPPPHPTILSHHTIQTYGEGSDSGSGASYTRALRLVRLSKFTRVLKVVALIVRGLTAVKKKELESWGFWAPAGMG